MVPEHSVYPNVCDLKHGLLIQKILEFGHARSSDIDSDPDGYPDDRDDRGAASAGSAGRVTAFDPKCSPKCSDAGPGRTSPAKTERPASRSCARATIWRTVKIRADGIERADEPSRNKRCCWEQRRGN